MEVVLQDWLTIAGIQDGELLAWKTLKKEVDPRCLDDALQRLESRPVALDRLHLNRQGRDFVLKLFLSTRAAPFTSGGSDFLSLCLREIVIFGHGCELFEEQGVDLCEDLHVFDSILVGISTRAKDAMQKGEPWLLDWQAMEIIATTAYNMQCACGSCVEAQCYALQYLKTIEAQDAMDWNLWFGTRQDSRWASVPERLMLSCQPVRSMMHGLFGVAFQFVKDTSQLSLGQLASAYRMHPCAALLRAPVVAARLFAVTFDPRLASEATINDASFLISEAATARIIQGEDGLCPACMSPWSESSAAVAEAASTAAALAACGRHCLEDPNASDTDPDWDTLLALSSPFPAARHGVIFWLKCCLMDPDWLSMDCSTALICLLKGYATHPQSQPDVFEVLKLVVMSPRTAFAATGAQCNARKVALLTLAELATTWRGASQIFHFVEHSSIDASELRVLIVHIARKISSPFSLWFGHAAASLLSCRKAMVLWRDLDMMPHAEQHAILSLSDRLADTLPG